MGRSLFGLGSRDDIVEPFGRSVSQSVPLGTGSVVRSIETRAVGGTRADGTDGEWRARTYFFFFSGSDAVCLGFAAGATFSWSCAIAGRAAVCIARVSRFERGSPSADAFPRRRREETTGTSASASRVPVPSRPAAVPPRRAMRDAREVRCPGDAADARARGCARRARGTSENHESLPGVLNGPLWFVVFRGFRKSRATLGIHDSSHQKWHRNERNAPMKIIHARRSFISRVYGAAAAPPALFAPPLRTPPGPVAGRSARLFARSAPAGHPTAPPAASGPSPSTNPYPTSALPDNGRPATGTASVRRLPPAVPNGGRGDVDPNEYEFRCLILSSGL